MVAPQPDPQLADPAYVFFGDSLDTNAGLPFGQVSTTVVPRDTFIGGDSTDSGNEVVVTTSRLLASLRVTSATSLPPLPGDTFTLRLIAGSNTFFADNIGTIPFASRSGTITIGAIPEPGSLALLALGMLSIACALLRRDRDRGEPRGSSPPTPPGIRVRTTAVRSS